MKIGVPVGRYHEGSTADYVVRALRSLGHEAVVLDGVSFSMAFQRRDFDLFFCVDSGETLSFVEPPFRGGDLRNVAWWSIDFRHNKDRDTRIPTDRANVIALTQAGGTAFMAQFEDWHECQQYGDRIHWLPLGADPDVWMPRSSTKEFHIGFAGNVWDAGRAQVLETLLTTPGLKFACAKPGQLWMEGASALLSRCQIGFNVNTFFGDSVAYDVNMRVFETLSCGLPLITNEVPSLWQIFDRKAPFLRTYTSTADLLATVQLSLNDSEFLSAGSLGRKWILSEATYAHRMRTALVILASETSLGLDGGTR